jgi:hypothetical protein
VPLDGDEGCSERVKGNVISGKDLEAIISIHTGIAAMNYKRTEV